MTNLILKQDNEFYVFDMPEEPKPIEGDIGNLAYATLYRQYEADVQSAISNAVRCEDQEKARELIIDTFPKDWNLGEIEVDKPYFIDVRFEIESRDCGCRMGDDCCLSRKVAVLHEEPKNKDMTGIELLAKERQKQIDKHGFTGGHHANNPQWYDNFQLQYAATTLLMHEFEEVVDTADHLPDGWGQDWFDRLNAKTRKERLIIAGALIAAEIDRLNTISENK